MKISKVQISNFRSYSTEISFDMVNLTSIVGINDIGKSTILEALDYFFNEGKGVVKFDKDDICRINHAEENKDITITVTFSDVPKSVVIDETNETNFISEYLLSEDGNLVIKKIYPNAGKENVYIVANHPNNDKCSELLYKKQLELKKIVEDLNLNADKTKNASMRAAIWGHYRDDLQLGSKEIEITKLDTKNIWTQLKLYLPMYSLFQSDRSNSDGDKEIQDPMKLAVMEIMRDAEISASLKKVAETVSERLSLVAERTCAKLKEMNPEIAKTLTPVIPTAENLKWTDVFKNVSITSDNDIPINKRGSGVKRLILLNFFRAEAERRQLERNVPDVIYALEEPETSQHPNHQVKLIESLIQLSNNPRTQIIITTHSPEIVKMLKFENLRLISNRDGRKSVDPISEKDLPYPSLNEVNFLAFNTATTEYHNELYGYIDQENWLNEYKNHKKHFDYKHLNKDGSHNLKKLIMTEYIRHQIHHPENNLNQAFTLAELNSSINDMRDFVRQKKTNHP